MAADDSSLLQVPPSLEISPPLVIAVEDEPFPFHSPRTPIEAAARFDALAGTTLAAPASAAAVSRQSNRRAMTPRQHATSAMPHHAAPPPNGSSPERRVRLDVPRQLPSLESAACA